MSQWQTNPRAKELVEICQCIIDGKMGVVMASRKIQPLVFELYPEDKIPKVFDVFNGIDSQTSHLPIGSERRHWSATALQEKDLELEECESIFRDTAVEAAQKTLELLKSF